MKQVERYFYPAVFSYAPDQEIAVTFPDLDVATSGPTIRMRCCLHGSCWAASSADWRRTARISPPPPLWPM